MGKQYIPLPAHPGEMDAGQLRALLGGADNAKVLRSLLVAEAEAIRGGAERESRTLRSLWYDLVKPALSGLGRLNAKTSGGKDVDWDGLTSRYLAELVRLGFTSYEELAIVDGSRQRQPAVEITRPVVRAVRLVGAHYPWLILFTEKDTIWGELQDLASLYGVSAISGGGEPSYCCTENTVKEILARTPPDQELVILSLTDYDPTGYHIAAAQFSQVQEMAAGRRVEHWRLGLEPGQLTPEERIAKSYEPKDKGLAEWVARGGGINGQPLGLELDALPMSRRVAMFAEGIEACIDLEARRADLRFALLDLLACELLRPGFEAQRRRLIERIGASPLGAELQAAPIPGGLFRWAAGQGRDCIDPLAAGLFDCADRIRQAMAAELGEGEP